MSEEGEKDSARGRLNCLVVSLALMTVALIHIGTEVVVAQGPPEVVWVDDDFPMENETHFQWISHAEQNVADNGTIYVHSGIYPERITITKNVTLYALNGTDETVVGAEDPWLAGATFNIGVGLNVSISGFTIVGRWSGDFSGIYGATGARVMATDNIFIDLLHGIQIVNGYLYADSNEFNVSLTVSDYQGAHQPSDIYLIGGSTESVVVNNTFKYKAFGLAIRIHATAIRLVANNTISQGLEGNEPDMGDSSGSIAMSNMGLTTQRTSIRNNTMTNGYWGVMSEGTNATVENNTFTGCRRCIASAAYMAAPAHHPEWKYPSDLTVANNTITAFIDYGLQVENVWSYMNATNNSITGSGLAIGEGVHVGGQGRLDLGPNNTISNTCVGVKTNLGSQSSTNAYENTIFNTREGFHSEGTDKIKHNVFYSNEEGIRVQGNANREISNNTIVGSYKRAGIWIYESSHNKKIWFNAISQGYRGIWITETSGNNDIKWNNISDNDYGIHLDAVASASPNPNVLEENNISFGNYGIFIDQSDRTTIQNNDIANNYESGIYISSSEFINITRSNITNNYIGIDVHSSDSTLVDDTSIIGNVLWAINATDYVDATDNYFGTNDSFRIDKLVSESVDYANYLLFRESGANITDDNVTISSDTVFPKGQIINGNLTVNPNVNITFANQTGHNFIQVNGNFMIVNGSFLKASHGNFTLLATNGSFSNLTNATFEKQMGIGIQTTNMLVTNCTFANGTAGIVVNRGGSNDILHSDFISNSRYGVYLYGSNSNTIEDNFIALSRNGVQAYNSTLDSLSWNNISANDRGIVITDSSYASIQNNNITNNYIGVETRISLNTLINNNSIVGNALLAILDGKFSFGTNAQNNYFGTENSSQIEKLCEGVDCSGWINYTHPNFEYIYGYDTWDTPQNLTKGVIVNGDLRIEDTQVYFNSSLYQNFIQVNWKMEANFSQFDGKEGNYTILYLNQSSGGLENSTVVNFRGIGVHSESGFLTVNSTFSNGTYGMVFWKARFSKVNNSVFESNVEWSVGLFVSDQNNISTSKISNSSIGVYIYASRNNTFYSNEIRDNPVGTWLDSKRLSITAWDPSPKDNRIFSSEFRDNDVGVRATNSLGNIVSSNTFSSSMSGIGVELSGTYPQNMSLNLNIFKDNEYGVLVSESIKNEIDNNTFTNNIRPIDIRSSRFLVHPSSGTNNVVTANNISVEWGNDFGIRVHDSELNLLANNMICSEGGPTGILIEYSDNNTFSNNSVSSSNNSRLSYGIRLKYAGGNNLTSNSIANFARNFWVAGESLWDFVQDIDSENTVDGRSVYYWVNENGNNSSYSSDGGYYAFVNSSYMAVGNVSKMEWNYRGILIAYSNHIFLNNVSASNMVYGAEVYRSNNISISNSSFSDFREGVFLNYSSYNVISNVSIKRSFGDLPAAGIDLDHSPRNLITNNTTISFVEPGIRLNVSAHNTISYTKISDIHPWRPGIYVGSFSGYTTISRCSITGGFYGIHIDDTSYNNISNNSITLNTRGIYASGFSGHDNLIVNNNISWNSVYGIEMKMSGNNIALNVIVNNTGYGVKILDGVNNWVHHNNMIGNNDNQGWQAYDLGAGINHWNDETIGNYWSDFGSNPGYEFTYEILVCSADIHPQTDPIPGAGPT